jgi:hypothetical protein
MGLEAWQELTVDGQALKTSSLTRSFDLGADLAVDPYGVTRLW